MSRKRIVATFILPVHEKEFNHFVSLFGSRYVYYYSTINGMHIVDVCE